MLQDFTGVPCVVDLAAMRAAMQRLGGDPKKINPLVPVDLVIDHSVQVDYFNSADALELNIDMEFARNRERYEFLRWGQKAFNNFRVVPPGTGIVHQVNLEYLAKVVFLGKDHAGPVAFPDSLVGTDSHTTMIDGLGVVGWGVGGIEAEGVMLGQPIYMLLPEVVGMELTGKLSPGATATDLVLTVTEILRKEKVVGKFVEFFGPGVSTMSLADRATIGNMAPEYGATMGFFPVDDQTLRYLRQTGRTKHEVELVERYTKEQGLFRTDAAPDAEVHQDRAARSVDGRAEPGRAEAAAGPRAALEHEAGLAQALTEVYGKQCPNGSPEGRWEGEGGHKIEPKAAAHADAGRPAGRSRLRRRADRMERQAVPTQARRRRDRRHHQLHQHEQPQRDGRRRPVGEEGRRKGPHRAAAREDEPRARLARRDRLLRQGRPRQVPRKRRLLHGRLRLHDLHRQQRPAARADLAGGQEERPGRRRRALAAIATSKAASIRT